ncbi:O-antigen ligase family protein [Phocicoccus pinnipedialis]
MNLGFIVLLVYIDQNFISIPMIIMAILYFLAFLFSTKKNVLGIFLFLMMISTSTLLYIANVYFLIFLMKNYHSKTPLNNTLVMVIILILYEGVHVLLNSFYGYDESVIKWLGFSICLILFIYLKPLQKEIDIVLTFKYMLYGFISYSVLTIGTYINLYNVSEFFTVIRRFGYLPYHKEEGFLLINPNMVGKHSAFIISCYLVLTNLKKIRIAPSNLVLIIYVGIIGALTVSRGFILVLLLILVLFLFMNFIKQRFLPIIVVAITGIMTFLIISKLFNQLIININKRIFETEDISGTRFTIYELYLDIIMSNVDIFIFGLGMQDYILKLQNYNSNIFLASHNIIIEVITIWGGIGLLIVSLFLVKLITESRVFMNHDFYHKTIVLIPLLSLLISAMFGQFFISYYHTFGLLIMSLIILNQEEDKSYV